MPEMKSRAASMKQVTGRRGRGLIIVAILVEAARAGAFDDMVASFERARELESQSIAQAREQYRQTQTLARNFRSSLQTERDEAAVVIVQSDKRLAYLKDRDEELREAQTAVVTLLDAHALFSAQQHLDAANPPSLDPRFTALKHRLARDEAEAARLITEGDSWMRRGPAYNPQEALKDYLKASDLNYQAAGIVQKIAGARVAVRSETRGIR